MSQAPPEPIYVTRPRFPDRASMARLVDRIWAGGWLTNGGPLATELTDRIQQQLGAPYFSWLSNGTVALEIAMRALDVRGSVLTTPLSYVATANSIGNLGLRPIFVDVDPHTCAMDPAKLAASLRPDTTAIMPVHVYGYPCDIDGVEAFAKTHGLTVIYDAAQAFGSRYRGRPVCAYGDATTYSFHATKVFNTGEGGGLVIADGAAAERADLWQTHGHRGETYHQLGTNAKNTELNAALGLLNLDLQEENVSLRRVIFEAYVAAFADSPVRVLDLRGNADIQFNYAYAPVIFPTEESLLQAKADLERHQIIPRRYFYPSLSEIPHLASGGACPVAEDLARRLLCLPIYPDLAAADLRRIISIVGESLAVCA